MEQEKCKHHFRLVGAASPPDANGESHRMARCECGAECRITTSVLPLEFEAEDETERVESSLSRREDMFDDFRNSPNEYPG